MIWAVGICVIFMLAGGLIFWTWFREDDVSHLLLLVVAALFVGVTPAFGVGFSFGEAQPSMWNIQRTSLMTMTNVNGIPGTYYLVYYLVEVQFASGTTYHYRYLEQGQEKIGTIQADNTVKVYEDSTTATLEQLQQHCVHGDITLWYLCPHQDSRIEIHVPPGIQSGRLSFQMINILIYICFSQAFSLQYTHGAGKAF